MLHSLKLTSNLLTACLDAALGRLLSPCCGPSFPLLLRCYLSCSWKVGLQHRERAHSSFVLAALGSSRTSVQIAPWILNSTANQHSRGPATLLPKLYEFKLAWTCFSFLQRSHILGLHFVQHLCSGWHNAHLYAWPGCYWNPNNDRFFFFFSR